MAYLWLDNTFFICFVSCKPVATANTGMKRLPFIQKSSICKSVIQWSTNTIKPFITKDARLDARQKAAQRYIADFKEKADQNRIIKDIA